jgi:hypothetical protein
MTGWWVRRARADLGAAERHAQVRLLEPMPHEVTKQWRKQIQSNFNVYFLGND